MTEALFHIDHWDMELEIRTTANFELELWLLPPHQGQASVIWLSPEEAEKLGRALLRAVRDMSGYP